LCSAIAATKGCRHPHTDCIAPLQQCAYQPLLLAQFLIGQVCGDA
jgi:hypothetical protein